MLNTLYKKLAAVLFIVISITGFLLLILVRYTSDMYQQEVGQKLNASLAEHIVANNDILYKKERINHNALKEIFHMLMVINPSIEVYLLDVSGKILAYSAPEGKVKRKYIGINPITNFINKSVVMPVFGDDPRDFERKKIFSAAQIPPVGPAEGYLYVILASEAYDSVTEMIEGSYILKVSMMGLGASLLIAMIAGLLMFSLLTGRLKTLATTMQNYLRPDGNRTIKARYPVKNRLKDEVESLGESFNLMANRIDAQVAELKNNDAKRRELIANVSHDLRTPLTSLHGYLETLLLKEHELSTEERKEYVQIAANHSKRLGQLIAELFELAKLDSVETLLNVEPFSLGELIQDVVYKFKLAAEERGISLKTSFGFDIPFAYGDIGLMQRVLDNLIENALRYTPHGGEISVVLTPGQGNIMVKISDTGCGIPKEELNHIFDRFYRLQKSRQEGELNSGLGLAIAKRIINLHGGQISAESTLDRGTTFTFNMPTVQSA